MGRPRGPVVYDSTMEQTTHNRLYLAQDETSSLLRNKEGVTYIAGEYLLFLIMRTHPVHTYGKKSKINLVKNKYYHQGRKLVPHTNIYMYYISNYDSKYDTMIVCVNFKMKYIFSMHMYTKEF